MPTPEIITAIRNKYQALRPIMDEKVRRRWAACEAMALGWGGITAVVEATGLARSTLRAGIAEVQGGASGAEANQPVETPRIRRDGGGRRRLTAGDRTLLKELIGDFKNAGREWHPQGQPVKVRRKDFLDKPLGKGIP